MEARAFIIKMVDWGQAFDRKSHKLGFHKEWSDAKSYSNFDKLLSTTQNEIQMKLSDLFKQNH